MTVRRLNPSLVVALVVLGFLTMIQEGVISQFTFGGVRPDLVMLAVVDWGLVRGVEEGVLWGFVGGFFVDFYSGLPFGTSSAAYVAIAGIVSLGETALLRSHVMLPVVVAALGTAIYYAIAIVIVASVRHELLINGSMLRTFVGVMAYNAVINPVIYVASRAFDRRLHPVVRASW